MHRGPFVLRYINNVKLSPMTCSRQSKWKTMAPLQYQLEVRWSCVQVKISDFVALYVRPWLHTRAKRKAFAERWTPLTVG